MEIRSNDALIVVDVQNDFCPGGALAVPGGDQVVPIINDLMRRFAVVVLTQDWHPGDHTSFASNHPGAEPFSTIEMSYGKQVLWPDHCIQASAGASFHPELDVTRAQAIIRKGFRAGVDSYSAFRENDKRTPTGLGGYLQARQVERAFFAGLALDFCVGYSALDARLTRLEAHVIEDACRPIDLNGSLGEMREQFRRHGVEVVEAAKI